MCTLILHTSALEVVTRAEDFGGALRERLCNPAPMQSPCSPHAVQFSFETKTETETRRGPMHHTFAAAPGLYVGCLPQRAVHLPQPALAPTLLIAPVDLSALSLWPTNMPIPSPTGATLLHALLEALLD